MKRCIGLLLGVLLAFCVGCQSSKINTEMSEDRNLILPPCLAIDYQEEADVWEWYRTGCPSYEWARIRITDWKEDSFHVEVDVLYSIYGGVLEGTAEFIDKDLAVLYDDELVSMVSDSVEDVGVYFHFFDDRIEIEHEEGIRWIFGGGGWGTAEGTYIQGEPEYTNCTDVGEIFTDEELATISELLGDSYTEVFKNVIELGEIEETPIENGRRWYAYWPPFDEAKCEIRIYDDGRIYIQGNADMQPTEFYTNTSDSEMPEVE